MPSPSKKKYPALHAILSHNPSVREMEAWILDLENGNDLTLSNEEYDDLIRQLDTTDHPFANKLASVRSKTKPNYYEVFFKNLPKHQGSAALASINSKKYPTLHPILSASPDVVVDEWIDEMELGRVVTLTEHEYDELAKRLVTLKHPRRSDLAAQPSKENPGHVDAIFQKPRFKDPALVGTVPVLINVGNYSGEFRLDKDVDPRQQYHSMTSKAFIDKYYRIMGEYIALMGELKELHENEMEPMD